VGPKARNVGFEADFAVQVARLAPLGSRERAAVMRAYNRLRREELPAPDDQGYQGGPVSATYWGEAKGVRKIPGHALWLWYRALPQLLVFVQLADYAPGDEPW